jgi:hypothetical protein
VTILNAKKKPRATSSQANRSSGIRATPLKTKWRSGKIVKGLLHVTEGRRLPAHPAPPGQIKPHSEQSYFRTSPYIHIHSPSYIYTKHSSATQSMQNYGCTFALPKLRRGHRCREGRPWTSYGSERSRGPTDTVHRCQSRWVYTVMPSQSQTTSSRTRYYLIQWKTA